MTFEWAREKRKKTISEQPAITAVAGVGEQILLSYEMRTIIWVSTAFYNRNDRFKNIIVTTAIVINDLDRAAETRLY